MFVLGSVVVWQTVGKYMIEIWKATGMDMNNVEFLWASEEVCVSVCVCLHLSSPALSGCMCARTRGDARCYVRSQWQSVTVGVGFALPIFYLLVG